MVSSRAEADVKTLALIAYSDTFLIWQACTICNSWSFPTMFTSHSIWSYHISLALNMAIFVYWLVYNLSNRDETGDCLCKEEMPLIFLCSLPKRKINLEYSISSVFILPGTGTTLTIYKCYDLKQKAVDRIIFGTSLRPKCLTGTAQCIFPCVQMWLIVYRALCLWAT